MSALIKLLVLVVAVGIAIRLNLLHFLRDAARQAGVPAEQIDSFADLQHWLSVSNIMEAVGSLPPPLGGIGKTLVVLVLAGLLISSLAACVSAVFRTLRWFRDLTI